MSCGSTRASTRCARRLAGGAVAIAVFVSVVALPHGATRVAPVPVPAPRASDGTLGSLPLQRANCTSWHAATAEERGRAVRALTATIGGGSTSGGVGRTMPDGDVSALFDRICGTPGTSSFVLYLIYAHAAAFSRQSQGPTPITAPPARPPL